MIINFKGDKYFDTSSTLINKDKILKLKQYIKTNYPNNTKLVFGIKAYEKIQKLNSKSLKLKGINLNEAIKNFNFQFKSDIKMNSAFLKDMNTKNYIWLYFKKNKINTLIIYNNKKSKLKFSIKKKKTMKKILKNMKKILKTTK